MNVSRKEFIVASAAFASIAAARAFAGDAAANPFRDRQ